MRGFKGIVTLMALLTVVTAAGFAKGSSQVTAKSSESASGPSGTITLYTSIPQPIADKIQTDFGNRYPAISLDIYRAGTSAVVAKLMTEKAAGQIAADLVWVAEPATYESFKAQHMLLKFTPADASALPPEMKDPDGYYYAGRLINMVIGYNPNLVTDPPKTWTDLLSPRFKGKIAMATPLTSGSSAAAVQTLVDRYGWKYFEDFKAVGGVQAKNNGAVRDNIANGEYLGGILLDYVARQAEKAGSPIKYVWPEDGAVFIPSPIAIIATTKNPKAAETFVDYILSADGQKTMVNLGSFVPVRSDVAPPAGVPGLNEIKRLPTNWKEVQAQENTIDSKWTALFGG